MIAIGEERTRTRSTPLTVLNYGRDYYETPAELVGTCTSDPGEPVFKSSETLGTYNSYSKDETMIDIVTPGFKRLVAEGKIVNNPLTKTFTEFSSVPLIYDASYDYCNRMYCGTYPNKYYVYLPYITYRRVGSVPIEVLYSTPHLPVPPLSYERAKAIATTEAWSRIGHDEMLLMATLAEANKTIVDLYALFRKAARIFWAVRKAQFKVLAGELSSDEILETYMNARYNLRPLYYDVKGVIKILSGKVDRKLRKTFRSRVQDSEKFSDDLTGFTVLNDGGITVKADLHREASRSYVVRAGVLTESEFITDAQIWGLDSIIETAWDLTPFSFIIDWFFNVGNIIKSFTPKMGINALASWVTVEETIIQKVSVSNLYNTKAESDYFKNQTVNSACYGFTQRVTRNKYRIPNYDRPVVPSFDLNLDQFKLLDLGIIAKSILLGKKPPIKP